MSYADTEELPPPLTLTSLLRVSAGQPGGLVEHFIGGINLTGHARKSAVQALAERSMRIRLGSSPLFGKWQDRRNGGPSLEETSRKVLEVYVKPGFGVPGNPANSNTLQGHVAELIWDQVLRERSSCDDGRRIEQMPDIKVDTGDHGADGLIIYKRDDGILVFRLWEVKKLDTPHQTVPGRIREASNQLSDRGAEYLAKLAGPETIDQDGELGDLYANMVELWLDESERAGAGVSIATSKQYAPALPDPFKSLSEKFPKLGESGQLEGLVVAVPDFSEFASDVRSDVWSGL